jgi:hypothetical protein
MGTVRLLLSKGGFVGFVECEVILLTVLLKQLQSLFFDVVVGWYFWRRGLKKVCWYSSNS